ncbi:MAG TPA: GNAT family N-acetyltransferase [Acidimicrobiales bacterium]|nr:GNAT family N-acetyltransferase [Acidimicrobiales bacterium]
MARLDPARETGRLRLRPFEGRDLDRLTELVADPSVNRYLYSEPRTADEARTLLDDRLARDPDEPRMNVCVALRLSDEMVGDFVLRWDPTHRQGEMGGSLLPAHQGHGYATEVYGVLLGVAFDELDLHRVVGRCDARNGASIRSLERAGLRREAHLVENEFVKGDWTSEVVLAQRAEPWRGAR